MLATLSRNWWVFLIRGIASILFGLMTLFLPGLTLVVLLAFFAAYAIINGAAAVFSAFASRNTDNRWWWQLIEGAVSILAGVLVLLWPDIAAVTLLLVIGIWAVLTGILQIVTAIRLRREINNEWLLGLSGVVSILFGAYLIFFPGAGALALAWLIGLYAIMFGVFFVALAFRLRGYNQNQQDREQHSAAA